MYSTEESVPKYMPDQCWQLKKLIADLPRVPYILVLGSRICGLGSIAANWQRIEE